MASDYFNDKEMTVASYLLQHRTIELRGEGLESLGLCDTTGTQHRIAQRQRRGGGETGSSEPIEVVLVRVHCDNRGTSDHRVFLGSSILPHTRGKITFFGRCIGPKMQT